MPRPLDPFYDGACQAETGSASGVASRLGTALFWTLMIVIVTARVAWFQPDLFASFHIPPSVADHVGAR